MRIGPPGQNQLKGGKRQPIYVEPAEDEEGEEMELDGTENQGDDPDEEEDPPVSLYPHTTPTHPINIH